MGWKRNRLLWIIFLSAITCVVVVFARSIVWEVGSIETYPPPLTSSLYSDDGKKIFDFYRENRVMVKFDEIPEMLVNAFLSAEDSKFFMHPGIDPFGIIRAFITNFSEGKITQGASTISQQLARECFLNRDPNYIRKIKEMLYAFALEVAYTKKEIFAFWLNHIYLGYGAYGIKVAAWNYFDKELHELNLTECAFLAGLPKSPSRYFQDYEQAKKRMEYVLGQMIKNDYISRIDADAAIIIPFIIIPKKILKKDHYVEHVRRYVEKKYGANYLYDGGLEIHIGMDSMMQIAANEAVEERLSRQDERTGSETKVEGALLSMERNTGYVRAMVGGRDFDKNQWNKAIQAKRQPGSAFKPFIYSSAFTFTNYNLYTKVNDVKTVFKNPFNGEDIWKIRNYNNKYRGSMSLIDAFAFSSNAIAATTLQKTGVERTIRYIHDKFKITSKLNNDLTLALGASDVSLFEMVRAYSVFANLGTMVEPIFVKKIVRNKKIIEENLPRKTINAIDYNTAIQISKMLRYAVEHGTGINAKIDNMVISGKTGTSSENRDAWFVGYTDSLVTGVWVGYEDFSKKLGHSGTGSTLAAPIFREYIIKSKKNKKDI